MKEQEHSLPAEAAYSVVEERKKFVKNLQRRVSRAVKNALAVTTDPLSGEIIEFRNADIEYGKFIAQFEDSDEIEHKFTRDNYCVSVENPHDYAFLLTLATIESSKATFNEYGRNAEDWLRNDEEWVKWQAETTQYGTEHESGHFLAAMEYTEMKMRLGVEFFRESNGTVGFRPYTDFQGTVTAQILRDAILSGPGTLSEGDQLILAAANENLTPAQ